MSMETAPLLRNVTALWVVPGLLAEGRSVALALAERRPRAVAVGVSPEELEGLRAFVEDPVEDEGWWTEAFASALSRYGAVGFPPPCYVEAVRYAVEQGVAVHGIDLSQDAYDEAFTKQVSAWQWWRHGRRVRKMEKRPPKAPDPVAFVRTWDTRLRKAGRGIQAVERTRQEAMRARLADLSRQGAVVAVLDAALQPHLAPGA